MQRDAHGDLKLRCRQIYAATPGESSERERKHRSRAERVEKRRKITERVKRGEEQRGKHKEVEQQDRRQGEEASDSKLKQNICRVRTAKLAEIEIIRNAFSNWMLHLRQVAAH